MRGHLAVLIALLCALPLAGCTRRDRTNPLDPHNPATHGRPAGFVALAGYGHVTLEWQNLGSSEVIGYVVSRRVEGQPGFVTLAQLPASQRRLDDFGLADGIEHHYRLRYLLLDGTQGEPAEDSAIPGPLTPWATDLSARSLVRLTADGRHVGGRETGFDGPTHVAVDPGDGRVWVADQFGDAIVIFDPLRPEPLTVPGFAQPTAIAVEPASHDAWICEQRANRVRRIRTDGSPGVPGAVSSLDLPISVAVDPDDASVWILENAGQWVRHLDQDGELIAAIPVAWPSRAAVDSSTGDAWCTSFNGGQVRQISPTGTVRRTLGGFGGPIGVAVDWRRDRVWIADALAGEVVALRRDGAVALRVGGLTQVRELAVDLATGRCWATVPGRREIVSITPAGAIASRLGGIAAEGIALDPGPGGRTGFAGRAPAAAAR